MDPGETGTFLFVSVGLEVQSDRVLTCLFPDQVAITLGLEVIKDFTQSSWHHVWCALSHLFSSFFGKAGTGFEAAGLLSGLSTDDGGVFFLVAMTNIPPFRKSPAAQNGRA